MIKILSEVGIVLALFFGFKGGGIQLATKYMLIVSLSGLALSYIFERKVSTFSLVSSGILLVAGGITLLSGNTIFIKVKTSILYAILSGALFISAFQGRPLMRYVLHETIPLNDESWKVLSYRFSGFFLCMSVLNEIVWRNFSEADWVNFKVFGAIPLTVVFILLQVPFLNKNRVPPPDNM